jgi:UPF0716 family protein affecting phage T7 exclusion
VAEKKPKKPKQPGKLKQLWRVYKITAKTDKNSVWVALLGMLVVGGVLMLLGFFISDGSGLTLGLWIFTALLSAVLTGLIIMSRRAERSAFKQIEGQLGAVGAVLDSQIKRGWRASSTPIAVNPKTREAVYRMIGKPGVVLISEGSGARVQKLLDDEARKITRAAPGVRVHKIQIVTDDTGVRLHQLLKTVYKLKKTMTRSEVTAVSNRLDALGTALPIPKGIDPYNFRPPRR